MSARSAVPLISRCAKCRTKTISAFIGIAGFPQSTSRLFLRSQIPSRSYADVLPRATTRELETDEAIEENEAPEALPEEPPDAAIERDASTSQPWYLQDAVHQAPSSPLLERQRLPDLPPDPPESLQSILEHLSVDIGLDHLRLLDLRALQPPPALGANLLMLVGTVRSEKHLHVSADRFSRWLRSEYRLRPFADGLLGRNELKIRLRRKAKRAKDRARRGLGAEGDADDGIRTGWVCMNVGPLEEGHEIETPLEGEGVVGFGTEQRGSTLVVQMVTEEKREELDLERLWEGALRRQKRREERAGASEGTQDAAESSEDMEEGVDDAVDSRQDALAGSPDVKDIPRPDSKTLSQSATHVTSLPGSLRSVPSMLEQKRALHSTARRLYATRTGWESSLEDTKDFAADNLSSPAPPSIAKSLQELEDLLQQLRQLPATEALRSLGSGAEDHASTEFLRSFFKAIPLFPTMQHWIMRFRLISHALVLGHPGYRERHLVKLLAEMQRANLDVPRVLFENVLAAVADPLSFDRTADAGAAAAAYFHNFHGVLDVLQTMSLRGLDPLSETVVEGLYRMINRTRLLSDAHGLHETAAANLSRVLARAGRGLQRVDQHVAVLRGAAAAKAWPDYWRYWRDFATRMERRPAAMYAALFRHAAMTRHADFCRDALDEWVPETGLELPRVELVADVARAVMECIEVAAPQYTRLRGARMDGQEPWADLWNTCVDGKDRPGEDPGDGRVHVVDMAGVAASALAGASSSARPSEPTSVSPSIEPPKGSEAATSKEPSAAAVQDDSAFLTEGESSGLVFTL